MDKEECKESNDRGMTEEEFLLNCFMLNIPITKIYPINEIVFYKSKYTKTFLKVFRDNQEKHKNSYIIQPRIYPEIELFGLENILEYLKTFPFDSDKRKTIGDLVKEQLGRGI